MKQGDVCPTRIRLSVLEHNLNRLIRVTPRLNLKAEKQGLFGAQNNELSDRVFHASHAHRSCSSTQLIQLCLFSRKLTQSYHGPYSYIGSLFFFPKLAFPQSLFL